MLAVSYLLDGIIVCHPQQAGGGDSCSTNIHRL